MFPKYTPHQDQLFPQQRSTPKIEHITGIRLSLTKERHHQTSLLTRLLLMMAMLGIFTLGACSSSRQVQDDTEVQRLQTIIRAEHLNSDALETLYRLNNPTESFRIAAQSWQLYPNHNSHEAMLKAYYADVFELDGALFTTPFYQTAYTFSQTIYNAAFSPDGQYLIADAGNEALLINATTGNTTTLHVHKATLYSAGFTPNSRYPFTTSEDFSAIVWDQTGNLLVHLKGHQAPVYDLHVSADGNTIATAGWDGTVKLWNWKGEQLKTIVPGNKMELLTIVRFSPDGNYLITSDGFQIAVFNLNNTTKPAYTITQTTDTYTDIAFSNTQSVFAVSNVYGATDLYDLNGKYLNTLYGHSGPVRKLSFSPDGRYLVTASADKTAIIWDASGTAKVALRGHQAPLYQATFSVDGRYILTTAEDGTARVWDWKSGHIPPLSQYNDLTTHFSPDGEHIITVGQNYNAKVWNWQGNLADDAQVPLNTVAYAFYPPKRLVTATQKNYETIINNLKNDQLVTLIGSSAKGYNVWFSPDEAHFVTADQNGNAQIWDQTGKRLADFSAHTDWLTDAAFSYNGKYLATASFDHTAKVWNLAGEPITTLAGHSKTVNSVKFSPNGRQLLTASKDGRAILWSIDDDAKATADAVIAPYGGELNDAAFSPDGNYTAVAAQNGMASLWNSKGQPIISLRGALPTQTLQKVRFSPDGKYLATVAPKLAPLRWPINPDALLEYSTNRGINPLSEVELKWYEADEQ
jgi:WD40 repeat protein